MTIQDSRLSKQIGLISLFAGSLSLIATSAIASEPAQTPIAQPSSVFQTTSVQPSPSLAQVTSVSQLNDSAGATPPAANQAGQVTSVSQLSDVRPTDWAFQALQSLVERYGCIAGYPDRTFRGNRATTRFEFAAGLNACLNRINELIAASTADLVKKEDLATLQKLQEQFAAELATLRGRVDALEARTTTLEKQQFSTTTKLQGEAIFSLAGAYTSAAGVSDANTVFNNRVRLNLNTSFSGRDLLITGLQAYNFGASDSVPGLTVGSGTSLAQTVGLADPVFGSSSNLRLSYEPQFPTADPSTLTTRGAGNSINLYKLLYIFPVANTLTAFVGTNAEVSDAFPSILPWASEGQGALSRFSVLPAAQRVSGGTSQTGLAAAAGLIFTPSPAIDIRALYGSVNANLPANLGLGALGTGGVTPLGAGVGGGSYVAAAQVTFKPSPAFNIGLNYANSYHQINILGTGLSSSDINSIVLPSTLTGTVPGFVGSLNNGIRLNTLGATASFRLAPNITIAGSYSYIFANLVDVDARTNFNSWLVGVQFGDVLRKGNAAGIVFGQPLKRVLTGGIAVNPENRIPYQIEGFFNFRVNDNLSITPGVFAIFNPEGISANGTVVVPVIRSTFTF